MKITKFVHSCLLVETENGTAIFDPGHYSWDSGVFNSTNLTHLDDIVISHAHADHLHPPFLAALRAKFPNATITAPPKALAKLKQPGSSHPHQSSPRVSTFEIPHEDTTPLGQAAQNYGAHYLGLLTHPGDSYALEETKAVLALPITAPTWGTLALAARLALKLKPRYIVPIHDWQLSNAARQHHYNRLEIFFEPHGITFLKLIDGRPTTINL